MSVPTSCPRRFSDERWTHTGRQQQRGVSVPQQVPRDPWEPGADGGLSHVLGQQVATPEPVVAVVEHEPMRAGSIRLHVLGQPQ